MTSIDRTDAQHLAICCAEISVEEGELVLLVSNDLSVRILGLIGEHEVWSVVLVEIWLSVWRMDY